MNTSDLPPAARSKAPAIDAAVDILDVLVKTTLPLTLSEIARRVDKPVASVHRVIVAMLGHGLVIRDLQHRKAYCAGARLFELASAAYLQQPIVPLFQPVADVLKNELHQAVNLSVAAGSQSLIVAHVSCPFSETYGMHVGRSEAMHQSAAGKAMMSMMPVSVQKHYWTEFIAPACDLPAGRPGLDEQRWTHELAEIKRVGYATHTDTLPNVCVLAAPVLNRRGEPLAAMGITFPAQQDVRPFVTPLIQATWQLSSRLG